MTSGPDSVYIEHSRAISLASWHTRVERPQPPTTRTSLFAQLLALCSVTILKPLFPHL
jgi:hypothetical protein